MHLIVTFLNILIPVLGLLLTDEFDLFRQHQVSNFVKLKWCDLPKGRIVNHQPVPVARVEHSIQ